MTVGETLTNDELDALELAYGEPGHRHADALTLIAEVRHWRKAAGALGARVIWALKFMEPPGGGGLVASPGSEETQPWEHWFMDALDDIGYVADRKKFLEQKYAPKKRRRR